MAEQEKVGVVEVGEDGKKREEEREDGEGRGGGVKKGKSGEEGVRTGDVKW